MAERIPDLEVFERRPGLLEWALGPALLALAAVGDQLAPRISEVAGEVALASGLPAPGLTGLLAAMLAFVAPFAGLCAWVPWLGRRAGRSAIGSEHLTWRHPCAPWSDAVVPLVDVTGSRHTPRGLVLLTRGAFGPLAGRLFPPFVALTDDAAAARVLARLDQARLPRPDAGLIVGRPIPAAFWLLVVVVTVVGVVAVPVLELVALERAWPLAHGVLLLVASLLLFDAASAAWGRATIASDALTIGWRLVPWPDVTAAAVADGALAVTTRALGGSLRLPLVPGEEEPARAALEARLAPRVRVGAALPAWARAWRWRCAVVGLALLLVLLLAAGVAETLGARTCTSQRTIRGDAWLHVVRGPGQGPSLVVVLRGGALADATIVTGPLRPRRVTGAAAGTAVLVDAWSGEARWGRVEVSLPPDTTAVLLGAQGVATSSAPLDEDEVIDLLRRNDVEAWVAARFPRAPR